MSADKKLNKYLAKLKNTRDVKDAKVYINKIMKYKHMTGKQSGGAGIYGDFGKVDEPIKKVEDAAKILDGLSDPEIKSKLTTVIKDAAENAISNGYTDEQVTEALSEPFANLRQLLGSVGKLKTDNVPTLDSITDIIREASKELGTGVQKTQEELDAHIRNIWDEKFKSEEPAEAPVEGVSVGKGKKGKGPGPVERQLSSEGEFVSEAVQAGGRRKRW